MNENNKSFYLRDMFEFILHPKYECRDHWELFPFIKICISFEIFVQYRFLKLLSTNILLFKECKYISTQKLTFLVQIMTLHTQLNMQNINL
jgi:hypothetical protein